MTRGGPSLGSGVALVVHVVQVVAVVEPPLRLREVLQAERRQVVPEQLQRLAAAGGASGPFRRGARVGGGR